MDWLRKFSSLKIDTSGDGVDWIHITGARLIAELDSNLDFFDVFSDPDFKGLLLGSEGLDRCIPNEPEFFVGTENHDGIQTVRGLRHIDSCTLENFLIRFVFGGYIQHHPVLGRSPIGKSMTGLIRNPCFQDDHWLFGVLNRLKSIVQNLNVHGEC